jgi:hypothetical protein
MATRPRRGPSIDGPPPVTPKKVRAAEATGSGGLIEPDDYLYRRLSTNGQQALIWRDLSPMGQERMLRLVYWLWESNPVAQWILETTVDFTTGAGVKIEALTEDVAAVLDPFLEDPVNQILQRVDTWGRELGLYGEVCLPAFVNSVDGHVRLGYLDPFEIKDVLTDPDNALIQTGVVRKEPGSGNVAEQLYKIIRGDADRASSSFGQLLENQQGEKDPRIGKLYDGACFLFQVNRVSNARRGRSDLLSLIDWVDGYDAFLYDAMQAAQQFNSYIWDVTLEGADEKQLAAWLSKNKTVKRGMIRAHNEKVKWQELSPDLKAQDKDAFLRFLRGQILGSRSFPEHWYGMGGDVTGASAKEMSAPPAKRLGRRQTEIRRLLTALCQFQIHSAIRHGRLKETTLLSTVAADGSSSAQAIRSDEAFRISMPEISQKDTSLIVAAAVSLVAALGQATSRGWVRDETAAKIFANLVSQLGVDVDPKQEFVSGGGPQGAPATDYSPANLQRLLAQLTRAGSGNGENVNQPKVPAPGGGA